ncbi:radical SAM protein [Actinokineospora bangkokensis]|uniref:Radical SAM core domain-containing protein n=1 Tax=Actinokineospora bangkokensis TaxID=1193682 RepID=A0A1Q9LJV9_9PSEU|nr:radical SAM protein [Actinokineospora bangkokensis]OLR92331.1 hypothetical protein BJP25_19740 [Actinokineospora bangkokensis]
MRLLRGRSGWWYVGRTGTALVPDGLVRGGGLTADGARLVSAAGLDAAPDPDHYSLTVVTDTRCNLACPYCFQNEPTGARAIAAARLTDEVIASIVGFTLPRMAAAGATRLELLLFGGEPLVNAPGCLAVLRAFGERVPTAGSMVSNGVLLTARRAQALAAAGLREVQVTLDGPREQHDRVRATRGGRSTFDRVLANTAAAQRATDLRFTVRVNSTPANLPALPDLLDHVARVLDPARTRLALAPVLDYGAGTDPLTDRDAELALRGYAAAAAHGFRLVRPRDAHCDFCSTTHGRRGAVVNADGTLFSCWDAVGDPDLAVGTVRDGYHPDPGERWRRCAGGGPATGAFADAVDAGLLDLIRAGAREGVTSR